MRLSNLASSLAYRRFGFLSFGEGDGLRFTWLQIVPGWGLAFVVTNREPDTHQRWWSLHFKFVFSDVYVQLPAFLPRRRPRGEDCFGDSWGFLTFERSVHLHWGSRTKIVHLPWDWEWYRTSYLRPDGRSWFDELASDQRRRRRLGITNFDQYKQIRDMPKWQGEYPYTYTLRSGEVQHRTATVEVREYERRRRWLRWTKIGARVERTIDINFDDEVGERSGTWKGGCVGCSYDLRPGESPEDALRRMERERKFE